MKHVLNVVRAGIAASICLTVLAACQDGRGQFKSRRSALAERCEWQKANGKPSECEGPVEPKADEFPGWRTVKPSDEPSLFGPKEQPKANPDEKKQGEPESERTVDGKDTNPGSAKGHTINEIEKEKAPAEEFIAAREKFIADANNRLGVKDPEVTKLIKGISILGTVDRTEKVVKIALDAVAVVGGKDRLVNMKPSPVRFETGSTISALDYNLREEPNGEPIAKKGMLKIAAVCAESTCADIRVLMEFEVLKGRLWAAFKLSYVKGDRYEISATNLDVKEMSEIVSFEAALENFKKAAAAEKPEKEKAGDGTTVVDREEKKDGEDKKEEQKSEGEKGDKVKVSPKNEAQSGGAELQKPLPEAPIQKAQKPAAKPEATKTEAQQQPAAPAAPVKGEPSGRPRANVAPSGGSDLNAKLPDAPIQSAQRAPTKPSSAAAEASPPTKGASSGRPHLNVAQSGEVKVKAADLPVPILQAQKSPTKSSAENTPAKGSSSGRPHVNQAPSGGGKVQSAYGAPKTAVSIEST